MATAQNNDVKKNITVAKAQIQVDLMADNDKLEDLREQHGAALAGLRIGDKGAATKAAKLALQINETERHISSLKGEDRALTARLAQIKEQEHIAEITSAQARVAEVAKENDALANEYAEVMRKAYELADRIDALNHEDFKLRKELRGNYVSGMVVRRPGELLNTGCIQRADSAIASFMNGRTASRPTTLPGTVVGAKDMSAGERFSLPARRPQREVA